MTGPLPSGWPQGRGIALSVSVMLEGWSEGAAPGVGPMGNVLPQGALDLQARSWADYGPQVGAWRLLDVLAAAKVRAVFYVSGVLAEQYPELLREIAGAGHAIAAHGWSQHVLPVSQSEEDERADLLRCLDVLEAASGMRPRGWISPRCTPSRSTAALLAEAGLQWHSDYFDQDLPRLLETGRGPLVAVPFTMEINDMPMSVRYGNSTDIYSGTLRHILEGWPLVSKRPFCLDLTVHTHVYGRPAGAIELARTLELAAEFGDLAWLTDHDTLGAMYARQ